jgi:hypothetical protein
MKVCWDINKGFCGYESVADDCVGMLSAFMAFIEQGDEVIIFEPFFDQSVLCDPRMLRN